jgi:hypothetical protein
MSEGKTKAKAKQKKQAPASAPGGKPSASIWLLYPAIVVIAAVSLLIHNYNHQQDVKRAQQIAAEEKQRRTELAQQNAAAGLPDNYPCDFMPLYPGVELLDASVEEAKADDGTPMDKWHVLSQSDDDKQKVYDFYINRLAEEDMRQTMFVSLPTGYNLHYADTDRIVEIRIEKLKKDPKLQVELTVYVVKGKPAAQAPVKHSAAGGAPTPPTSGQPK